MSTSRPDARDGDALVLAFMIADIRGYSRFSREFGNAAAAALATRFAELVRDAVEARGGTVIELRGDEALATFPTAAQAVQAAVEFQLTCAEETQRDPSLPLLVGVGIEVGPAVRVEDGYRAIAINLAARLCSAAGANQVLITAAAAEQLAGIADEVELVPRGESTYKGFEEPVPVVEACTRWRPAPLTDLAAGNEPLPPDLMDPIPLVGRVHETRWLRGIWRQARRGRGRVVAVSGSTGMGKTRLAAEIAAHVQQFGGDARYAGAGGLATATALAAVAEARTAQTPMLVVIDHVDAVGADAITAAAAAIQDIGSRPVLVLVLLRDSTANPAVAELVDRCTAGGGHRQLAPLSPAEVGEIVALYAGDADGDAPVEKIVRASRGIPALAHEQASDWARAETSRRLEAAAEFMAAARDRRAFGLEFANNVIGLKLGKLYGPDGPTPELDPLGPYKGLASFEQDDAAWFFGREQLIGELAARVVASGALAVLGASGSGKSSIVAAGLLPSLRAGLLPGSSRWRQDSMRPGEQPMAALRTALSSDADDPVSAVISGLDDAGRLVLVVDQLEEVFTACASEAERNEFLDLIANAAVRTPERFVVVATMRSDFYGELANHPVLATLFADNHVLVGPLSRTELHRVVQLPAQRAGVRIETALVDALVEEAIGEPGALPLLSTALVELWQQRSGGWIRATAYREGGGIRGAVARIAEASYSQLDEADQAVAKRVLTRLASSTDGEAATRRRVEVDEFDLDRDLSARRVIDRFATDRLLTASGTTVEVAHEALLREWPRLRAWLDEDVHGRQLRANLTAAAKSWEAAGRERSELYRGARLSAVLQWAGEHPTDLNDLERTFLNASRDASQAEAERARRTNRRLRALLVGAVVLLLVAAAAGVVALVQRSSARNSADRAQRAAVDADARRVAALAMAEGAPDLSLLLGVEAVRIHDDVETRANLYDVLGKAPDLLGVRNHDGIKAFDVSPDGARAVATSLSDVSSYAAHTLKPLAHNGLAVTDARFSPDSTRLAVAVEDAAHTTDFQPVPSRAPLRILDSATLRTEVILGGLPPKAHITSVAFSGDGRRLAAYVQQLRSDGQLPGIEADVWDLARPSRPILRLPAPAPFGGVVRLDPAGRVLYLATDQPARLMTVDVATGLRVASRSVDTGASPQNLAVSRDGSTSALVTARGVTVFHGTHLAKPAVFESVIDSVQSVALSADGLRMAAGLVHGRTLVWDVANRQVTQNLDGYSEPVVSLAFGAGHELFTAGGDGNLIAWDTSGASTFADVTTPGQVGTPCCSSVSPNGKHVAYLYRGQPQSIRFRDVTTGALTARRGLATESPSYIVVTWSPDSTMYVNTGGPKYVVQTWDPTTGTMLASRTDLNALGAAVSGDSQRILVGASGGELRVVDRSLRPLRAPIKIGKFIWGIAASPVGTTATLTLGSLNDGPDGQYVVVDTATGSVSRRVDLGFTIATMIFSPDGTKVAVTGDGELGILDARNLGAKPVWLARTNGDIYDLIAWSADGSDLVTTRAGAIDIWNGHSLAHIGSVPANPADENVAASVVGHEVVMSRTTGNLLTWDLRPQHLLDVACQRAGRNFTKEEWHDFFPGRAYSPPCSTAQLRGAGA